MDTFNKFKSISDLGVNLDKTSATQIGLQKHNYSCNIGIKRKEKPIETLGISINGNIDHYLLNFKKG